MNRRHFFKQSGLAIGATAIGKQALAASPAIQPLVTISSASNKKIGLQLYSLRIDLGKNVDATLKAVADIGYKSLESYGYYERKYFGKMPSDFNKQLADLGMCMSSSHTGFGIYQKETDFSLDAVKQNMEDTRTAGAKWIVQAGYPGGRFTTLDEVKKLADTFNRIGELARSFGLLFAYHNHTEEFSHIQHKIPYQQYIELTDKELVSFQMDIGHVANVMGDYVGYLLKYPARFKTIHLRDTNISTKHATEFGLGDVRFQEVFQLFDQAGVEDYYVEQEEYDYEPLESVKRCYDFLDKAPYVKW